MAAIAVVLMTGLSTSVFGVASFARQTGLDCTSCHSELGFPTLNSFGAAFRAGGYTTGAEDNFMGDGEELSLPKTFNMSGVLKVRYQNRSNVTDDSSTGTSVKTTSATSKLELPDEYALFFGGRIGKNIGWVTEFGMAGGVSVAAARFAFVTDIGSMKIGIAPFLSGNGPGFGQESLSTGQMSHVRASELKNVVSSQIAVDHGGFTDSAGVAVYLWSPMFFINYSSVTTGTDASIAEQYAHYIRAAFTPTFGGLEAGIGFSMISGNHKLNTAAAATTASYLSVDAQIQGNVGIPLGAYVTYAADKQVSTVTGSKAADLSGFSVFVEAGLIPGKLQVGLGFGTLTNAKTTAAGTGSNTVAGAYKAASISGKSDDSATSRSDLLLNVKYNLAMNMRFQIDMAYNLETGAYTLMPMIFGSF